MEKVCKGWEVLNAKDFRDINPGDRILMGPGPSDVPARTLQALAAPCIGHLDPYFLEIMNEVQQLLRFLFQTENELTIPVSGTGSAGMETCFVNLVEPDDEVVVCVNGVFGTRMADIIIPAAVKTCSSYWRPWKQSSNQKGIRRGRERSMRPRRRTIRFADTNVTWKITDKFCLVPGTRSSRIRPII